jgi:hypothetical protein
MEQSDMPSAKKIKMAELVAFRVGVGNKWPCARKRREMSHY